MRSRNTASIAPLLAPVHILILSVIVVPSLYVIWLSLNTSSFGQASTFVGLQNYIDTITDPAFRSALWNTVVLVVVVRRQNIWLRLQLRLAESRPRLGFDIMRRACGAASAAVGWSVV